MVTSRQNWPDWWDWELDCSNPHLAKRMLDRSFTETDLRDMLESATAFRPGAEAGRFIIETSHGPGRGKSLWSRTKPRRS